MEQMEGFLQIPTFKMPQGMLLACSKAKFDVHSGLLIKPCSQELPPRGKKAHAHHLTAMLGF